jgi:hypothetical protein
MVYDWESFDPDPQLSKSKTLIAPKKKNGPEKFL